MIAIDPPVKILDFSSCIQGAVHITANPIQSNPKPAGIGVPWRKRLGDEWRYGLLTRADHANPAGAVHSGILAASADHTLGCYVEAAAGGAPNVTIQ